MRVSSSVFVECEEQEMKEGEAEGGVEEGGEGGRRSGRRSEKRGEGVLRNDDLFLSFSDVFIEKRGDALSKKSF